MRVQVVGITDRGIANQERLHLRAIVNLNIAYLVVLNSRYGTAATVFPGALAAYWFPGKMVMAGDNIILYSNAGPPTQEANPQGTSNHFYHWGFPKAIWADPASCVVVLDTNDWLASPPQFSTPAVAPPALPPLPPLPGH